MLRNPGTRLNGSDPSRGAQLTSLIAIASRRFRASDSRPLTAITPTSRHSSVRPSKEMPSAETGAGTSAWPAAAMAGEAAPGPATAGALSSRLPKPKGTRLLLGRAAVVADHLDHAGIGQGGRVAQDPVLGDVAQEAAHDLARAG